MNINEVKLKSIKKIRKEHRKQNIYLEILKDDKLIFDTIFIDYNSIEYKKTKVKFGDYFLRIYNKYGICFKYFSLHKANKKIFVANENGIRVNHPNRTYYVPLTFSAKREFNPLMYKYFKKNNQFNENTGYCKSCISISMN